MISACLDKYLDKYDVRRLKKIVGRLAPLYKLDCRQYDIKSHHTVLSSLLFMIVAARQLENKSGLPLEMSHRELAAEMPVVSGFMHDCYVAISNKDFGSVLPAPYMVAEIISLLDMEQLKFLLSVPAADFGLLYQCLQLSARDVALESVQISAKKINDQDLIAITQQYTPGWVCDFLLQNSLLPLWKGLPSQLGMPSYMQELMQELSPDQEKHDVEHLKILDPCCGAGTFLIRALPFLIKMYEASGKFSRQEALELCLDQNLAGCDIDALALDVAGVASAAFIIQHFQRTDKCLKNLVGVSRKNDGSACQLGSLAEDWQVNHPLSARYNCIVTNPPYLGRKLMDRSMKQALKEAFPLSCGDLSAAFLDHGCRLLAGAGRLGFITQSSVFYLPTFEKLRRHLLTNYKVVSAVELGSGVFPLLSGEKVSSLLLILENSVPEKNGKTAFFRPDKQDTTDLLMKMVASCDLEKNISSASAGYQTEHCAPDRKEDAAAPGSFRWRWLQQADLLSNPKAAMTFWCPPVVWSILAGLPRLEEYCRLKQGLATGDNARFVRYAWDIEVAEIGNKYVPYVKGAGGTRWLAPVETVVNWENNGAAIKQRTIEAYPYLKGNASWVVKNEDYYFKEGITYSLVGSKLLSARKLPSGCIFDVAGSALFPLTPNLSLFLAYLNSSFAGAILNAINPTLNFQIGDLSRLPWLEFCPRDEQYLAELVSEVAADLQSLPLFIIRDVRSRFSCSFDWGQLVELAKTAVHKQEAMEKRMTFLDEENDRLFLAAAAKNLHPDNGDRLALWRFCEEEKNKRAPHPLLAASYELALAAVCALMLENFFQASKAVALIIDSNGASGFAAELLNGLSLLAREARQELPVFLKTCLERHFSVIFSGHSPYRMLLSAGKTSSAHAIIVLHVPHLRKIVKQGSSSIESLFIESLFIDETLTYKNSAAGTTGSGMLELARNVAVDLGHKLSKMPDWTSKDLEIQLSRYEGI